MKTDRFHSMFEKKAPLSFRDLKKYFGRKSSANSHELEMRLSGNAFSAEAAEGFAQNPKLLGVVPALVSQVRVRSGMSSSFRWFRFSVFTSIPVVLLISVFLINQNISNENYKAVSCENSVLNDATVINQMTLIENVGETTPAKNVFQVVPKSDSAGILAVLPSKNVIEFFQIPSRGSEKALLDIICINWKKHARLDSYGMYPLEYFFDMKVVDYERLYDPQKIVRGYLSGIEARYESKSDTAKGQWVEVNLVHATRYMTFLSGAMEAFSASKFNEAISLFNILAFQNPGDVNAQFYGGLCYFYTNRYDAALKLLILAEQNRITVFDQESKWFVALSLQKLGRIDEYKKIMEEISESNGFYSDRAKSNLLSLK
ncbi:MAG: hypothetical protein V2A54_14505 [Bacteroidota bacterium]